MGSGPGGGPGSRLETRSPAQGAPAWRPAAPLYPAAMRRGTTALPQAATGSDGPLSLSEEPPKPILLLYYLYK